MPHNRDHPKADCYRVLLSATIYLRDRPTAWWPVIAADSPEEAAVKAMQLYGGPESEWSDRSDAKGLPVLGDVVVVEVQHLHSTALHDGYHTPSEPPDVRRHQ